MAGLIGIVVLWFILAPDFSGEESLKSGFNTTIPNAAQSEMADDKQAAYEKEERTERDVQREEIKTLAEQLIEEDKQKVEVTSPSKSGTTSRPNYHKPQEPKDKIIASTEAYRDMNKTLGDFYDEPKSNVDPEKEAMQEELDQLKEQLALQEQIEPTMGVDEQIALMEKSYELAAKYMPNNQNTATSTPQEEVVALERNGKAVAMPVGRVEERVVSSLYQPLSDTAFIKALVESGGRGFNTAVGSESVITANTISACIHENRTVIDGESVRIRLLEAMRVGKYIIPKNSLVTGHAKVAGERLTITITTIEHQKTIIPVDLTVHDSDGQEGIFIPNSMEINAAKEIVANMGSSLGSSINISTDAGAQLASDLGKGLIEGTSQYIAKKMRVVKVHLKSGYKLMLYQQKN